MLPSHLETFAAAEEKSGYCGVRALPLNRWTGTRWWSVDPVLARAAGHIAGALFAPTDESVHAQIFTRALGKRCAEMGARFHYGVEVPEIESAGERVNRVWTIEGAFTSDWIRALFRCVQTGCWYRNRSASNCRSCPVKGYSATLPITDAEHAPRLGGVDEEHLSAYCPMGDRLRLTATAGISAYSTSDTSR